MTKNWVSGQTEVNNLWLKANFVENGVGLILEKCWFEYSIGSYISPQPSILEFMSKNIYLFSGSDLGGSVRMPAIFSGITALKPTAGRLPLSGQGLDGGLIGVVGLFNTLGFMSKSARGIEECMRLFLNEETVVQINLDARFIPLAWSDKKAKQGKTLKIGW